MWNVVDVDQRKEKVCVYESVECQNDYVRLLLTKTFPKKYKKKGKEILMDNVLINND
jgi:hypothetical protein